MTALLWLTIGLYAVSLLAMGVAASERRKGLEAFSRYTLFAVFGLHTLLLLLRAVEAGHAPMMGQYETLLFFGWSLALLNLILILRATYQATKDELAVYPLSIRFLPQ